MFTFCFFCHIRVNKPLTYMKLKNYLYLVAFFLLLPLIMLAGHALIGKDRGAANEFSRHTSAKSIYWWKTTFDPDSTELAFLCEHDIRRMYVRYFDVIYDPANRPETIVPNATLQFRQAFPDSLEIIPTLYITNTAMANWPKEQYYSWEKESSRTSDYYIDQIVYRILAMNQRNHVMNVREVQVDCDWTRNTRSRFFDFCRALRARLHEEGIALSSTVRLHQLCEDAPPVDRGVLMCYNTGALRNVSTKNSILHADDVYAYLKGRRIKNYGLPLDVAYPTFGWSVMYDADKNYVGLVKTTDLTDASRFEPHPDGFYRVLKDCSAGHAILKAGNWLRLEESEMETLRAVKSQIDLNRNLQDSTYSTILYHLDSNNLNKYSYDEIESLYQ